MDKISTPPLKAPLNRSPPTAFSEMIRLSIVDSSIGHLFAHIV